MWDFLFVHPWANHGCGKRAWESSFVRSSSPRLDLHCKQSARSINGSRCDYIMASARPSQHWSRSQHFFCSLTSCACEAESVQCNPYYGVQSVQWITVHQTPPRLFNHFGRMSVVHLMSGVLEYIRDEIEETSERVATAKLQHHTHREWQHQPLDGVFRPWSEITAHHSPWGWSLSLTIWKPQNGPRKVPVYYTPQVSRSDRIKEMVVLHIPGGRNSLCICT